MSVALHLTLVLASLIAMFPIVWVILSSFKPGDRIQRRRAVAGRRAHLEQLRARAGPDEHFPVWFLNSAIVGVFTMVIGVFISASTGYALSRFNFPGRRQLMLTFLVTQMFPVAILIVPIYVILASSACSTRRRTGHRKLHHRGAVLCVDDARLLRHDLDLARRSRRHRRLRPFATFWRLILPLARPGLAVTAFFTFLTAWGEVAYASAFLSAADESKTLAVGLQVFVQQNRTEWGHLAAASMLVAIPAVIVFYLVQRFLVTGLASGAVKG